MTAAYSVDLRKKIVEAYQGGKASLLKVAKAFNVNVSSVKRYLKQYREEGNLQPKKGDKGRPAKISEIGYETIQKIIQKKPTITLAELSEMYHKKTQVKAGKSVLSRACLKLNLRRKKLSRYAAERERDDVKKNGRNILK
jgi:transposase